MKSLALVLSLFAAIVASADCVVPYWTVTSSFPRAANHLVAEDFDGDGRPDVAGNSDTEIFLIRNDGKGVFTAPVNVYTGAVSGSIVAGEFNNGANDIAFAHGNTLAVLPGNGNGAFGAAIETPVTIAPSMIAAGKFDQNLSLDLVAVDPGAAKLVFFRNNGAGSFTEARRLPLRENASAIVVGDFDADGYNDVIVAYLHQTQYDAFYGKGDMSFDSVVMNGANLTIGLLAADLDGDGLPDLAIHTDQNTFNVLRNAGGRVFGDLHYYAGDEPVFDIRAADVTGDGKVDLLTPFTCGFWSWGGTGFGTFTFPWIGPLQNCQPPFFDATKGAATLADFDGDHRIDVMLTFGQGATPAIVNSYRNRCGDGVLAMITASHLVSVGQSLRMLVYVTGPNPEGPWLAPSGTATFREGDHVLTSVAFHGTDETIEVSGLTLGDHAIVGSYTGDAQYEPFESEPFHVQVTTATTTTALEIDPPVTEFGQRPSLRASVTASANDSPTGYIEFIVDGHVYPQLGRAPKASMSVPDSATTVGTHFLGARFAGDATHPPSNTVSIVYAIPKQVPDIHAFPVWTVAGTASQVGLQIVNKYIGAVPIWIDVRPTGTVALSVDAVPLGTRVLAPAITPTYDLPALPAGHHELRVTYTGDANFAATDVILPFVVFPANESAIDARAGSSGVVVSWSPSIALNVQRTTPGQPWTTVNCCPFPPWVGAAPEPETVYLYRVAQTGGTSPSNVDVAMRFSFTDENLLPGAELRPTHMQELLRATNILRAAASLPAVSFPASTPNSHRRRSVAAGGPVLPASVTLLRNAINEARVALGAYPFLFNGTIGSDTVIRSEHIRELREAVR